MKKIELSHYILIYTAGSLVGPLYQLFQGDILAYILGALLFPIAAVFNILTIVEIDFLEEYTCQLTLLMILIYSVIAALGYKKQSKTYLYIFSLVTTLNAVTCHNMLYALDNMN